MKRILIALALIASVQVAGAQNKSTAAAMKALESAEAASQNPKKAAQVATWTKLGKAYLDAFSAPAGNLILGSSQMEVNLLNKEPIVATTEHEVSGAFYTKVSYANKDLYYNQNGQLVVIDVTKPLVENPLVKALDAYKKAADLDVKGSKSKDIAEGIKNVSEKMSEEAFNAYTIGDYAKASLCFEAAADASATKPYATVDTSYYYNAGFTAHSVGDLDRAEKLFNTCVSYKYYASEGDVFAKLADIAKKKGDMDAQKSYLEEGFKAFPQSQSILVSLINYYIDTNSDTGRLFELLAEAKVNEPNNASLYYVEGDIYSKLGDEEKAVAAYRKCAEINPSYEYGFIGEGIMFYNKAADIQIQARDEVDDAKYAVLAEQFEIAIKACIEPFESAFKITKDAETKSLIAEYLKNSCYRFSEDPVYKAKYDEYKAFLDQN